MGSHLTNDVLNEPRLLVVGRLGLDRIIRGDIERVSQEAPVLLMRAERYESRLARAARVAQLLRELKSNVDCAGIIGRDDAGKTLTQLLQAQGVDCEAIISEPTCDTATTEHYLGRSLRRGASPVLEVENSAREPSQRQSAETLNRTASRRLASCHAMVLYEAEGLGCGANVIGSLTSAARNARVPVIVAPSNEASLDVYHGASAIVLERKHLLLAAKENSPPSDTVAENSSNMCRQLALDAIFVLEDAGGLTLLKRDGEICHFAGEADSVPCRETAVAMIAWTLASGASMEVAAAWAAAAGSRPEGAVHELSGLGRSNEAGIMTLTASSSTHKVVRADALKVRMESARNSGQKVVFTNGCFDILHEGHVAYLEEAAAQGDQLIVALNSDASVRRLKGPTRPVRGEHARASVLAALACVDCVVIFDEPTPIQLIEAVRPDVLVKGGDWRGREDQIAGRELVESNGGRLYLTGIVAGVSTTNIVRSIAA